MRLHSALVGVISSFLLVAAGPMPATLPAEIGDNGSVIIEGVRYADAVSLKAELDRLKKRNVTILLRLKQDHEHSVRFEVVGRAILLFQKAGYPKVGFVVRPREH